MFYIPHVINLLTFKGYRLFISFQHHTHSFERSSSWEKTIKRVNCNRKSDLHSLLNDNTEGKYFEEITWISYCCCSDVMTIKDKQQLYSFIGLSYINSRRRFTNDRKIYVLYMCVEKERQRDVCREKLTKKAKIETQTQSQISLFCTIFFYGYFLCVLRLMMS